VSVRRAVELGQFSHGGWYAKSTARDQSALRLRIREIAHSRPRFGYLRIHVMLRREGWAVNKKRVYRWYRLEGLQIRMRLRRRKHMCLHRGPVPQARRTHERWSMDFVHDQLFNGRPFRVLTIVDQFSRQTPLLEPGFSFCGRDVVAALDRAIQRAGTPSSITVDHGTEFTSKALEEWVTWTQAPTRTKTGSTSIRVKAREAGRQSSYACSTARTSLDRYATLRCVTCLASKYAGT